MYTPKQHPFLPLLAVLLITLYTMMPLSAQVSSTGPGANTIGAVQTAEVPVDMFTGTTNFNIPVYSAKSGGATIPISVSYNTSGIKVRQPGTLVGLGWNLNVGGGIYREVKGSPDEYLTCYFDTWDCRNDDEAYDYSQNYLDNTYYPNSLCQEFDWEDNYTLRRIKKGRIIPYSYAAQYNEYVANSHQFRDDDEADIFYLNIGDVNVRFILKENNNTEVLNASDAKVFWYTDYKNNSFKRASRLEKFVRGLDWRAPDAARGDYEIARFVVVTPDGLKYHFEGVERAMTGKRKKENSYSKNRLLGAKIEMDCIHTAWKLTKISGSSDEVLIEILYEKEWIQSPDQYVKNFVPGSGYEETYQNSFAFNLRPSKIIYGTKSQSEVLFRYNSFRHDTVFMTHSQWGVENEILDTRPKLLDSIEVKLSGLSSPNLKYIFSYGSRSSYFGSKEYTRDYLNAIEVKGIRNEVVLKKNLYSFDYNALELSHPEKNNEDFWGFNTNPSRSFPEDNTPFVYLYYNDDATTALLGRNTSIFRRQNPLSEHYSSGVDRNADAEYCKAGALQAITNMQGEQTLLEYEAHQFIDPNVPNYTIDNASICKSNLSSHNCSEPDNYSLVVNPSQKVLVSLDIDEFHTDFVTHLYGSFCVGAALPPPVCNINLSSTGAAHYVDLAAPGTADNYLYKKLKLSVDEPNKWGVNTYLYIDYAGGSRQITKNDISGYSFEMDLPLDVTYVSFRVESPMGQTVTCTYDIERQPKKQYAVEILKDGIPDRTFDLNSGINAIELSAGNYTFNIIQAAIYNSNIHQKIKVGIRILNQVAVPASITLYNGGGLRIRSVTKNFGENGELKKSYLYSDQDNVCSGRLLFLPEFQSVLQANLGCVITNPRHSNIPINSAPIEYSSYVAYKRVTEITEGKGKSVSQYYLSDYPLINTGVYGGIGEILSPPVYINPDNKEPMKAIGAEFVEPLHTLTGRYGRLISTQKYNAANDLIYDETSSYQNFKTRVLEQKSYVKLFFNYQNGCPSHNSDHLYKKTYYQYFFDDRPLSTVTTSYKYDENGNPTSSVSSVTYEYRPGGSSIKLPKKTTTVNGGIETIHENILVADLPGNQETWFRNRNMLYAPIEKKVFRDGIRIGGERISYADFANGKRLPQVIETWMIDGYIPTTEYKQYNNYCEPTEVKDLLYNRTRLNTYEADFEGLQSSAYNGRTVSCTYYPDRLLHTRTTSADGIVMTYEYDPLGILLKSYDNITGYIAEEEYIVGGSKSTTIRKIKNRGREYPPQVIKKMSNGVLLEATEDDGLLKVKTDFARSSVESESTFAKGKTVEQYEASLNPSWKKTSLTTWPGEWTERSTYTGGSAKTKVTDPDGRYSETVVDGLGRIVSKGRGGVNAGYTYDAYGRITQISQAGGGYFNYTYEWDGSILKTKVTVPGGGTTETKTNLRGQVVEMKDEMGRVFTYEYDSQDRLSVEKLGGSALKTYTYYNSGINVDKVATITHRTLGNTIVTVTDSYTYDSKGRLINEGYSSSLGGSGRSYEYNNVDFAYKMSEGFNVTGMTGASANWRYTTNDDMHRVANEYLKIGNWKEELVASYGYNAQKKVSAKTLGGNLQTVDYEYNGADWLKNINYIKDCVYDVQEPPKDGNVVTNMGVVVTFTAGSNPKQVNIKTSYSQVGMYNGNTVYTYNNNANSYAQIKQNINRYPGPVTVTWTGLGSTTVLLGTITQRIIDSIIVAGGGGIVSNDSLNIRTDIRDLIEKGNRKPCILDTDDAFAEEILYNYAIAPDNVPMKGGLICGTRWQVGSRKTIPQYAYSYDGAGWLTDAKYRERNTQVPPNHTNAFVNENAYNESAGYTGAGDISAMSRSGYLMTSSGGVSSYGGVDAIMMTYGGGRMQTITELGSQVKGWQTATNALTTVSYDAAGNILRYPVKGISDVDIEYNHLNLPQKIVVRDKGTFTAIYDAMGRMWSYTIQPVSGSTITRYFRGGWEAIKVDNDAPQVVGYNHAHGRHVPWVEGYIGEYAIADHIGNQRVFVRDENGNGRIEHETEIWHEKHFYPYGQPMEGNYSNNTNTGWYNRNADVLKECYDGHNNMDYVAAMELDMYFTTFRSMDPGTGRWMQVDPKAVADPAMSVYASMGNNPVSKIDPAGDFAVSALVGGLVGMASYAIQSGYHFSWSGMGDAFAWGMISGAASFGIGQVAGAIGGNSVIATMGLQAAGHGLTQGGLSYLQGGNFWQGAATGAVSSIIAGGAERIGGNDPFVISAVTLASGGISGGLTSMMTGGDFWDGAKTGLIVAGLNHVVHTMQERLSDQDDETAAVREAIAQKADDYWSQSSANWSKNSPPRGVAKCNLFVHDVLKELEINPTESAMQAKNWGSSKTKIPGFKVVRNPQRGDIAAFAHDFGSRGTGHMGIMTTSEKIVYASSSHNVIARTNVSNFGSGAKWVYWRYIGNLLLPYIIMNFYSCDCDEFLINKIRSLEQKDSLQFSLNIIEVNNASDSLRLKLYYDFPWLYESHQVQKEYREIEKDKLRSFNSLICLLKADNRYLNERHYFHIVMMLQELDYDRYFQLTSLFYDKYKEGKISEDLLYYIFDQYSAIGMNAATLLKNIHKEEMKTLVNKLCNDTSFTESFHTYFNLYKNKTWVSEEMNRRKNKK